MTEINETEKAFMSETREINETEKAFMSEIKSLFEKYDIEGGVVTEEYDEEDGAGSEIKGISFFSCGTAEKNFADKIDFTIPVFGTFDFDEAKSYYLFLKNSSYAI